MTNPYTLPKLVLYRLRPSASSSKFQNLLFSLKSPSSCLRFLPRLPLSFIFSSVTCSIQEEIKSRLKLENACYYSVKNLLSSSLLTKKLKIKIYRTIILPVVLYGCETWSLTLRDERRLRVLENRVLRRVFGPKRDEVTGEWRKLHNEELSHLYSLPNIVWVVKSRRMRWAGHVARMGEGRVAQGSGWET